MKRKVIVIIEWIVGLALLALGIAGLVLPVLQGWLFIFAGLAILSRHSRWAQAIEGYLKRWLKGIWDRIRRRRRDAYGELVGPPTTTPPPAQGGDGSPPDP